MKQQIDARDNVIQLEVMLADAREKANSAEVIIALIDAITFIKDMYNLKECQGCERVKEQSDFEGFDCCVTCRAIARRERQVDGQDFSKAA